MKSLMKLLFHPIAVALAIPVVTLLLAACNIDSSGSSGVPSDSSGTIYDFSGRYANIQSNDYLPIVTPEGKQSGKALTWLRLMQSGSRLEGYDSAGKNWSGTLSAVHNGYATFNLSGQTTAGADVEIAGKLTYNSGAATMDAAWLEPSFSGNIMASASVAVPTTNTTPTNTTPTNSTSVTSQITVKHNFDRQALAVAPRFRLTI